MRDYAPRTFPLWAGQYMFAILMYATFMLAAWLISLAGVSRMESVAYFALYIGCYAYARTVVK